jgi:hypothetical protein
VRADLILDPERLDGVPVHTLLEAAACGYLAVDHRFLRAILDHPATSIPDLVRFAARNLDQDRVNLEPPLLDIFRVLKTPEALPFLMTVVRHDRADIDDDLVETIVQLGAPAVDPLLELLANIEKEGHDAGEIPFLLSVMHVRDPRILEVLTRRLANDSDSALYLDFYGDSAAIPALQDAMDKLPEGNLDRSRIQSFIENISAHSGETIPEPPEPFDIWELYAAKDSPNLDPLDDSERLAMLDSGSAEVRAQVAMHYRSASAPNKILARLIDLARHDPDGHVRGECWEALSESADDPEMRKSMLAVLEDPNASIEEKGGVAVALSQQSDNETVFQAIEQLYADPLSRAKALKAISRSFDRRFAAYPPKHLDDPDPEVKRQAIWGVGYLSLQSDAVRLEPFLDDEEFRSDALFAYALAVPGETTRGRIRAILKKVDDAAGGFKPDEEELVQIALDQRLMIHGQKPVFFPEESEDATPRDEQAVSSKPGRNDPCPCGSGKKYKKCCGAN